MMQLRSAREAWSAAFYERWDSISSMMAEQAELGIVEAGGFIKRKIADVDEFGRPCTWTQHIYCPPAKQDRVGRTNSASKLVDRALAGHIQKAVSSLSPGLRAFGNHMYSPIATIDDMEAAEQLVWEWYETRRIYHGVRVTAEKREKAFYVAKICLHRYRRMHQGGMSAGIDPTPTPEAFRAALNDVYGVKLRSSSWDRDWQSVVDMMAEVCNDIDKLALQPVAAVVAELKEAA
ncbi:hypothetical protein WG219_11230 [Ectopseudomonas mendocina]|uniref:Phage protein n=1 Tax=Ectopseudomonas mendocina TaxID=300 RepID=A0ABZ2RD57_ECTME